MSTLRPGDPAQQHNATICNKIQAALTAKTEPELQPTDIITLWNKRKTYPVKLQPPQWAIQKKSSSRGYSKKG